jgi:very-short-patch-repair endonuclease
MGRFHFFTTAELRSRGETAASISHSISTGARYRVIKGWYATPETPKCGVLAMRMGGRLGCISALALHGAWVPPSSGLHVVFPTAASGRRSAGREAGPSVVRHWAARADHTGSAFGVVPLELAVADALTCVPPHLLIAILDSLLFRRLISRNRLEAIVRRGPKRVHHLIAHLEPRSESGIESIVRYLLTVAGIRTKVQVKMLSGDRTDIEVDDWLVIEADGRETHATEEAFTRDRVRVVRLMREGRIVLQFAYATIMYDFDFVLEAVRDVITRHAPVA